MEPNQQTVPPALTRAQLEDLVEYTLDVGRQMMECGAEAWRTENTMGASSGPTAWRS